MSFAPGARMNVLRIAAMRAAGRGGICDPMPKGTPLRPSRREPVYPALIVPEQIRRVTRCAFGSTVDTEMERLTAHEMPSSPPFATEFKNAAVFGGQIFSDGRRYMMSTTSPYRAALGPVRDFAEVTLAQSHKGSTVFGHWLMDDCAMRELPEAEGQNIAITRPAWNDCARYEELFDQSWEHVPAFTARRLTVLDELGFSADKAARHRRLRKRIRQRLKPGPGGVVYLARGPSGLKRDMVNEGELLARLEAAGVAVVTCETGSDALMRRCLDARIILGIEGNQLCHAIYMLGEGGAVMAIQPPDRFCNAHHDWSRYLGMWYGTVVGTPVGGGWSADPDEVLAMIETLKEVTA